MSIERFTPEQIEQLEKNPNVKKVSDKSITYTESFKEHFIIEYNRGKLPSKIFEEAGFNVHVLGERIKNASYRWKQLTLQKTSDN